MTRKEKELQLLKLLNLQIGDKIRFEGIAPNTYKIVEKEDRIILINASNLSSLCLDLFHLIKYDYMKVITYKDSLCSQLRCPNCPLKCFNCEFTGTTTVEENFLELKKDYNFSYIDWNTLDILLQKEIEVKESFKGDVIMNAKKGENNNGK